MVCGAVRCPGGLYSTQYKFKIAVMSGAGPRAVGPVEFNDNKRHQRHSPVSSPTEDLRKDKRRSEDSGR